MAKKPERGNRSSYQEELVAEQAYIEWAYQRLDEMISRVPKKVVNAGDINEYRAQKRLAEYRRESLETAKANANGLTIGRLDDADGSPPWYVGRAHVDGTGDHPAVVDYRSPIGERFLQATKSEPLGVGRRRNFDVREKRLRGFEDDQLVPGFVPTKQVLDVAAPPTPVATPAPAPTSSSPATATPTASQEPEEVHGEVTDAADEFDLRAKDLLLAELEESRTGRMQDVVATIQADQDRLMRADPSIPLVVQGGPGTGKTVVGLQRAAWVLYKQREQLQEESVLIVGPNERFLRYIGSVLPSLGETRAAQQAIDQVALSALPPNERDRVVIRAIDDASAERFKGGAPMAEVVRRALWAHATPMSLRVQVGRSVELSEAEVQQVIDALATSGLPYRDARLALSRRLAQKALEKARSRGTVAQADLSSSADVEARLREQGVPQTILPELDAPRVISDLLGQRDRLLTATKGILPPTTAERLLHQQKGRSRVIPWTLADLPLIDEAHDLIAGDAELFSHVVVDEAQDLSPMQWRMIRRRARQDSMTILGDIAQGTTAWAPDSWEQALTTAGLGEKAEIAELRLGYRVPRPIIEFASQLLPEIAPDLAPTTSFREGEPPQLVRAARQLRDLPDLLIEALSGKPGSSAVLAPNEFIEQVLTILQTHPDGHRVQPTVLEPREAKGLEFDNVVVIEPAAIAGTAKRGLRLVYVALTRATQTTTIIAARELPEALRDLVPAG